MCYHDNVYLSDLKGRFKVKETYIHTNTMFTPAFPVDNLKPNNLSQQSKVKHFKQIKCDFFRQKSLKRPESGSNIFDIFVV